jgi:hypothetical protein
MERDAAYLLKHLIPERETVQDCWRRMGIERATLQRIIELDYHELAAAGLRLHGATTSQAASLKRHIEINGTRYSHISRWYPELEEDLVEDESPGDQIWAGAVATVDRSDPRVDTFLKECGI